MKQEITFTRLSEIAPSEILSHMSDTRVAEHLPLLTYKWDLASVATFVAAKEACWEKDGLGHWAILNNENYIGWGGFQKEDNEWDYGLVLKPSAFGLGAHITRKALAFAANDKRIPFVTFLLPLSRKNLSALDRLGAKLIGKVNYEGTKFLKYRLETE